MKKVYADSVSTKTLRETIEVDYFKVRHYRVFFFYLLFLATLAGLTFSQKRVSVSSKDSTFFMMEGTVDVVLWGEFQQIGIPSDYYEWLRKVSRQVYPYGAAETSQLNVPLGLFVVRQLRGKEVTCAFSTQALPANTTQAMQSVDYRCRDDDTHETKPYGDPTDPFEPGHTLTLVKDAASASSLSFFSSLYKMDDPGAEYTTPFYFNTSWVDRSGSGPGAGPTPVSTPAGVSTNSSLSELSSGSQSNGSSTEVQIGPKIGTLEEALAEIDRMEKWNWLDGQTKIASVDFLMMAKSVTTFTRLSLILEQTQAGAYQLNRYGSTFKPKSLGSAASFTQFLFEFLLLLGTFLLVVDLVLVLRVKYKIHQWEGIGRVFGFWELLSVSVILMLWFSFAWKMQMWALGNEISKNLYGGFTVDAAQNLMFSQLCLIGRRGDFSNTVLALALLPASTKMLMYFHTVKGLHMIVKTIQTSISDIGGIAFISLSMFLLFSAVATIFFGSHSYAFATVSNSFSTLVQMIVAAEVQNFDVLLDASPRVAVVFFSITFFLFWLLFLNLMVGIIVTAFATAQQQQGTADDQTESVTEVFFKYFLLKGEFYKEDVRLQPTYKGRRMTSSVAVVSAALKTQMTMKARLRRLWDWQNERYVAIITLRDLVKSGKESIALLDLPVLLPDMADEHRIHFYRIVRDLETHAKQTMSMAQENEDEVGFKLRQITQTLEKVGLTEDELAQRLLEEQQEDDCEDDMLGGGGGDDDDPLKAFPLHRTSKFVRRQNNAVNRLTQNVHLSQSGRKGTSNLRDLLGNRKRSQRSPQMLSSDNLKVHTNLTGGDDLLTPLLQPTRDGEQVPPTIDPPPHNAAPAASKPHGRKSDGRNFDMGFELVEIPTVVEPDSPLMTPPDHSFALQDGEKPPPLESSSAKVPPPETAGGSDVFSGAFGRRKSAAASTPTPSQTESGNGRHSPKPARGVPPPPQYNNQLFANANSANAFAAPGRRSSNGPHTEQVVL